MPFGIGMKATTKAATLGNAAPTARIGQTAASPTAAARRAFSSSRTEPKSALTAQPNSD